MKCSKCSQKFICVADNEELARSKLEEQLKTHFQEKHSSAPPEIPSPLEDEEDNSPPSSSANCAKCKKKCLMFAKNHRDLNVDYHCTKCGQEITEGMSYLDRPNAQVVY